MLLKEHFILLAKSFNPDAYERLVKELSLREAWRQFFFNFTVFFLLMVLLFIPALFLAAPAIQARLGAFDRLLFDVEANASQPVTLLRHPDIVVDLTGTEVFDTEEVLVTRENVTWGLFFGKRSRTLAELKDGTHYTASFFLALLFFLLPSLAFWSALLSLVAFLLLILCSALLAWLLPRAWRFRLSFPSAMKLSLFAASVLLLQLPLIPLWRAGWWVWLFLYWLFLLIGVLLVGERSLTQTRETRRKGRRHEIWD